MIDKVANAHKSDVGSIVVAAPPHFRGGNVLM
jgi:hypothetical protein